MAKKFDLTLELAQGFHHFFEDHKDKDDYRFLLNRMNALEVRVTIEATIVDKFVEQTWIITTF